MAPWELLQEHARIGELNRLLLPATAAEERLAPYAAAGVELVRVPVPAGD